MTDFYLWQDKEIRFDIGTSYLQPVPQEKVIIYSEKIEDAKGNPGENGIFKASNLRCVWYQLNDPKINLSIGYDCIITCETKVYPTEKGLSYQINIKAKQKNSRFEFIFQINAGEQNKIFETFKQIWNSYEQTKLYREIRARGAITENKNLATFEKEKVINKYQNVGSVSQDSTQTTGFLYLTNVRLAWFSTQSETFNISIPWITMKNIKKKDLKSGPSMIIESRACAGGYIVGYQSQELAKILQETQKMFQFFNENPVFGVETNFQEIGQENIKPTQFDEDVEIIDHGYNEQKSRNYAMNNASDKNDGQIIFSKELGLAIEKPPIGVTIDDLWKIINIK